MITREQVRDLQPGDVVELSGPQVLMGARIVGPLVGDRALTVGGYTVRHGNGELSSLLQEEDLTVVSRAPRPLYANHPRTEAVPGDVVRDADDETDLRVWFHAGEDEGDLTPWCRAEDGKFWWHRDDLPARLRLLVDGTTGQVVQ